jgi:hypothetical protein
MSIRRRNAAMRRTLREVLTRPEQFFEAEGRLDDPAVPLLIVSTLAAVSVLSVLPAYLWMQSAYPLPTLESVSLAFGDRSVESSGLSATLIGAGLLSTFLEWLVHGTALYLGTLPFASDGSYRDLLVATGWGYLPQIVASLVTLAAVLAATVIAPSSVPTRAQITLAGHAVVQSTPPRPLYTAAEVIGAALTVWSGYVWVGAVSAVRGVSRRIGAGVVALLVILFVGL